MHQSPRESVVKISDSVLRVRPDARGALAVFLAVASVQPALAYVDPGTGSMLVQMAIAGLAGAMFYFRELRMQLASWFRRAVLGRPDPASVSADSGDQQTPRADS